ncbi:23 kDa integral membrane protein [Zeugodacus cucurbitae]|uniref:23 kDa integral membrane protein n=1 Tax=Zeugodacus cucurbitae TaxID=28588 RepID=UPI0023D8E1F6|nr:23 kDa integral membrane protein [Zeugodacus cucurbitae]
MGWCEFFIKWLLYFFNLLAVIVGILLIILGSLVLDGMGDLKSDNSVQYVNAVPIIVIVLGGVIFIVSFFGCCGAIKEINWCILLYSLFMFILMCLQIALVVWAFLEKQDFLNSMNTIVHNAFENRNYDADNPMNILQITFSCCGYNNYTDYGSNAVPPSCCGFVDTNAPCPAAIYTTKQGCQSVFYNFWYDNIGYVRIGGIVVIVIEFLALVSGCGLAGCIRNSKRRNIA